MAKFDGGWLRTIVQLSVRIEELECALQPFADAVNSDNGDVTIAHVERGHYLRAKHLLDQPQEKK